MTRQRSAVAELLDRVDDFRSAQQLHDMLRAQGDAVGLATVYRTLQSFAETGDVDVRRTAEGESLYRRCTVRSHHHHLVCRSCGATVEVAGGVLERWATAVGADHGFVAVEHTAELTGICARCAAVREQPDRTGTGD
jgi:Fur family ferric uptake transcriptional regulator